ncbi:hypothetical protein C8Q73DRAFT_660371 [Cubamyces lactineus]|nr:hypothetical protein C8Q73DRAFT_660371 [Cubamyces lactineus]
MAANAPLSSIPPQSSTVKYEGPFYVLLGGPEAGIYQKTRPSNTALGQFASLVPIVVVCSVAEDANAIQQLNPAIFSVTPPKDAYRLVQLIQWEEGPVPKVRLETPGPYYAIRYGIETGIYIGFHWQMISHLVPAQKHIYKGFPSLALALEFMLMKPGYNMPLLPLGERLPPPEFPYPNDAPDAPNDSDDAPPPPSRAASPVKPKSKQPPSSPTKASAKGKKVKVSVPAASSTATPARVKGSSPATPTTSTPARAKATPFTRTSRDEGQRAAPGGGYGDSNGLSVRCALMSTLTLLEQMRQILRRVINPAYNMPGGNTSLPITLGESADSILRESGLSAEEVLMVFQIYVHSNSEEQFTHYMGLALKWQTIDSFALWKEIRLPAAPNVM